MHFRDLLSRVGHIIRLQIGVRRTFRLLSGRVSTGRIGGAVMQRQRMLRVLGAVRIEHVERSFAMRIAWVCAEVTWRGRW